MVCLPIRWCYVQEHTQYLAFVLGSSEGAFGFLVSFVSSMFRYIQKVTLKHIQLSVSFVVFVSPQGRLL